MSRLLERDPQRRLTAAEALQHAWLRGDVRDRRAGAQLSLNVVQRIQRFGRLDYVKRSLLELMAAELVADDAAPVRAPPPPSARAHTHTCARSRMHVCMPASRRARSSRRTASSGRERALASSRVQDVNYCKLDEKARPVMDSPRACAMGLVLRYLRLDDRTVASRETIAAGLQSMGYRLREGELERLCASIGGRADTLSRAAVIASQIDWRYMQKHQKERWAAVARRAFDNIDTTHTGAVSADDVLAALHVRALAARLRCLLAAASVARSLRCLRKGESDPHEDLGLTSARLCRTRSPARRCRRCTRS